MGQSSSSENIHFQSKYIFPQLENWNLSQVTSIQSTSSFSLILPSLLRYGLDTDS
jgi:hypothetical protein